MRTSTTLASLLVLAARVAAIKGFNYGATFTTGAAKEQSDFEDEFKAAAGLEGTSGFTSARLYTMIQSGTTSDPISAIPAALNTGTTLLLGLWASGGDTAFANEILALKAAITQYGSKLASAVDAISVGSEDLYRDSAQGKAAGSDVGASADTITKYISEVREAIAGTALANVKVGHVDTWTAWVDGSNTEVIKACDWIGQDAYPYFQSSDDNSVENGKSLFDQALAATVAAVGSKPVWITETGFPVSGKTVNKAVPSIENAKTYWDTVGCPYFESHNVWWYTLQDAEPTTPNPSFGIVGSTLGTTPLFNLTCGSSSSSSSSSAAPSSTGTGSAASQSGTQSPSTSSIPDSGGSPGGVASSQIGLESSAVVTPSATTTAENTGVPTETQSSGVGSGSGSGNGTYSTGGSPSSASHSAGTTASHSSIPTAGQGQSAVASSATFVGFLFAVVAAALI